MLVIKGDDEIDIIELPNGMRIEIDFGREKSNDWGWRGRISGKWRRVRLYDKRNKLLAETIEENPLYNSDAKIKIPQNKEVIY